jgi:hypothetical protein
MKKKLEKLKKKSEDLMRKIKHYKILKKGKFPPSGSFTKFVFKIHFQF